MLAISVSNSFITTDAATVDGNRDRFNKFYSNTRIFEKRVGKVSPRA